MRPEIQLVKDLADTFENIKKEKEGLIKALQERRHKQNEEIEKLEDELKEMRYYLLEDDKVYAACSSRDCDLMQGTDFHIFSNGVEYLKAKEASFSDAEGPVSWHVFENEEAMKKAVIEYPGHRDLAAESTGY